MHSVIVSILSFKYQLIFCVELFKVLGVGTFDGVLLQQFSFESFSGLYASE